MLILEKCGTILFAFFDNKRLIMSVTEKFARGGKKKKTQQISWIYPKLRGRFGKKKNKEKKKHSQFRSGGNPFQHYNYNCDYAKRRPDIRDCRLATNPTNLAPYSPVGDHLWYQGISSTKIWQTLGRSLSFPLISFFKLFLWFPKFLPLVFLLFLLGVLANWRLEDKNLH